MPMKPCKQKNNHLKDLLLPLKSPIYNTHNIINFIMVESTDISLYTF